MDTCLVLLIPVFLHLLLTLPKSWTLFSLSSCLWEGQLVLLNVPRGFSQADWVKCYFSDLRSRVFVEQSVDRSSFRPYATFGVTIVGSRDRWYGVASLLWSLSILKLDLGSPLSGTGFIDFTRPPCRSFDQTDLVVFGIGVSCHSVWALNPMQNVCHSFLPSKETSHYCTFTDKSRMTLFLKYILFWFHVL